MAAASPVVGAPLAYKAASFSLYRLNKRRMLAGPLVETGEPGAMAWSAERFKPFRWTSGVVWVPLLAAAGLARPSEGFCSSEGSSCIGDGSGGGMFVPSVREPNLRSRAGSWNFVPVLLLKDGMMQRWVAGLFRVGGTQKDRGGGRRDRTRRGSSRWRRRKSSGGPANYVGKGSERVDGDGGSSNFIGCRCFWDVGYRLAGLGRSQMESCEAVG